MNSNQPHIDISHELSSAKIVKLALLFEIPLACPFLLYAWYYQDFSSFRLPHLIEYSYAVILSMALLSINICFYWFVYKFKIPSMTSFIEGVIEPLAKSLSPLGAILVSIAAGVGEEFFFRGFLLPYVGLVISSLAFAILHFMFEVKRFIVLCVIYTFIGLLFGVIYQQSESIWTVVIFHSVYDFLALLFFASNLRLKFKTTSQ